MSINILIRVDASVGIGTGHVMRCLTLADALRKQGATCRFVCREHPGNLIDFIQQWGYETSGLPMSEQAGGWAHVHNAALPAHSAWLEARWEDDAEQTKAAVGWTAVDWLIVDHYALDARWERAMRSYCRRLMVIDDLADREHDCDLLLDQNLGRNQADYQTLVPVDCQLLTGPTHALLRPEFATNTPCERDRSLRRLLVNFGGTDPTNTTGMALAALERLGWFDRQVDVVIGRLHPQAEAIAARCAAQPNWTLHVQTPHIAGLMQAADFALSAGGTSTWERCAAGLPSMVLSIADNQRPLAAAVAEAGAALWPGDAANVDAERLAALLAALDQCPQWLRSMSRAARALCDGRGTSRVVRALLAPSLSLRPATANDETLTLEWRNHPQVRRYSGDGQAIAPERHSEWFSRVLADSERALLIAEVIGKPVAVVRFDGLTGDEPELSIYLDPSRMGTGWGGDILCAAAQWLHGKHLAKAIRARINPDNHASQNAFRKAGYQPQTQWWVLPL